MHLSNFLVAILPATALAYECVTSGSLKQVEASKSCCESYAGKFCGDSGYQGICVVPDKNLSAYKKCTVIWGNPTDDRDCIPGDGSELTKCTSVNPLPTTTSAREALTE